MLNFDDFNYVPSILSSSSSSDGLDNLLLASSSDITIRNSSPSLSVNDSSSSSSSSDQPLQKPKANRKRRIEEHLRALYYLPRIPKRDIRRQFVTMFSNAYNSHHFDFMKSYWDLFYREDFAIVFRKNLSDFHYKEVVCEGSEKSFHMWYDSYADIPDMVFTPQKTQIKVRTDGTAVISATFQLTGTKFVNGQLGKEKALSNHKDHRCEIKLRDEQSSDSFQAISIDEVKKQDNKGGLSAFDQELEKSLGDCLVENNLAVNHLDATTDQHDNNVVTVPFVCDGYLSLHLDSDSKIYYCNFSQLTIF